MYAYEVGKPYIPGRTNWPEAVEYNYRGGGHELRMFMANPTAREIAGIARGPVRFGLVVDDPAIVLVYRFEEAIPWSDAPYTIHAVPEDQRTVPPEIQPGERALLTIIVIDARSGIIKGIRALSFTEQFSRRLHQAIRDQAAKPFDQAVYDAKLAALYRQFSSKQLYGRAVVRMELPGTR